MLTTNLRTWIDENTGREVTQLTDGERESGLGYFRLPRHMSDGRMIAYSNWGRHGVAIIDPETGDAQPVASRIGGFLNFRRSDDRLWYANGREREVFHIDLPDGKPELLMRIPDEVPGRPYSMTIDGKTLLVASSEDDQTGYPAPTGRDAAAYWHYISRPRRGTLYAVDVATGDHRVLVETQGHTIFHIEACPGDPSLVRYAVDVFEGKEQRVYAVRTDGTGHRAIRPQEKGEVVTHEFWWSDGVNIGYTYQDRRNDARLEELPWCEYAPVETRLGIANSQGEQIYLSDPINHYHTHLHRSLDGSIVSGSGTDGHSFVYAAPFSWDNTRIDFIPLATVHTPYVPFRGQMVNGDISADGRWMIYSDAIDGVRQLCRVAVDL